MNASSEKDGYSHREIAVALGLSRSRVFFIEKLGLLKLKKQLSNDGVRNVNDFQEFRYVSSRSFNIGRENQSSRSSELNDWIAIDSIISLNSGSVSPIDISRAFNFLRLKNESVVSAPIQFMNLPKAKNNFRVSAVTNAVNGKLMVKIYPRIDRSRIVGCRTIAWVESIFDSDQNGQFDVPLLMGLRFVIDAP